MNMKSEKSIFVFDQTYTDCSMKLTVDPDLKVVTFAHVSIESAVTFPIPLVALEAFGAFFGAIAADETIQELAQVIRDNPSPIPELPATQLPDQIEAPL